MGKILKEKWNKLSLVHKILFAAYTILFENILLIYFLLRPIHHKLKSYSCSEEVFDFIIKSFIILHWTILFPIICCLIISFNQKGQANA